jgi:hypothetical protein
MVTRDGHARVWRFRGYPDAKIVAHLPPGDGPRTITEEVMLEARWICSPRHDRPLSVAETRALLAELRP